MRDPKSFKPFVFLLLMIVACLPFYLCWYPVAGIINSLQTQSIREHIELTNVLKRASMDDRTVIVTTLNQSWAAPGSILDLFLESFQIGEQTKRFLNHLLIIATDHKAFDRCKAIHPHCYSLTTPGVDFNAEKQFVNIDYPKLMWRKIEFLKTVLELGYSFIFTDADVMWLRNPFPHFSPKLDMHSSCDYYTGNPTETRNSINGGFYYVRSNAASVEFFKYWHMSRVLYPGYNDQSLFNIIKSQMINFFEIKYLETVYFGGFCQPSKDMNKVCTMHANCCIGTEKKLHDLKLVLEDWNNFTKLSTEERRLNPSSSLTSPWKAPSLCKS